MSGFRPTAGGSSAAVIEGVGYVDIGTKRFQFGQIANNLDGNQDFDLPMPFADDEYSLVLTSCTLGKGGNVATKLYTDKFTVDRENTISGTIIWNWQAMGEKP